ncbi:MAG: SEC-C domain-containing protein [Acidimicrobiia bacterium]
MTADNEPRDDIDDLERRVVGLAWDELRHGPMHFDELLDLVGDFDDLDDLAALTESDPETILDDLLNSTEGIWTTRHRYVARIDVALDGSVFTHRLTEAELHGGEVAAVPDLMVVDWAIENDPALEGGGLLEKRFGSEERGGDGYALAGPDGWLEGFAAGDLIGFRRVGDHIRVERVEGSTDGDESDALEQAFADVVDRDGVGVDIPILLMEAMMSDEELSLFRNPVHPITELLPLAGLERRGELVGPAGTNFEDQFVVHQREQFESLFRRMDFEPCCRQAFARVREAWSDFEIDGDRTDRAPLLKALSHGTVAPALAVYAMEDDFYDTAGLDEFAAYLAEAGGSGAAAAEFLRGVHAEFIDDALAAEAHHEAAVGHDPGYGPGALELARYRLDRGRNIEALRLLRRSGVPADSPDLAYLARLIERRGTRRNDPCPCGSGNKFKACCLLEPKLTTSERIGLLTRRVIDFATAGNRRKRLFGLALSAAAEAEDDEELFEGLGKMMDDPFILDLFIFEGGGLEEYLEVRGPLLTDEDRATLGDWSRSRRALYEVVEAPPGEGMTLRDTRTGDREDIAEALGSQGRSPGDLLLGRVVTVGDTRQLIGNVLEIDLRQRASLLRLLDRVPDADALAAWYGSWSHPPSFANREGEPLVFCEAELMPVPDDDSWPTLAAYLDDAYRVEGPDRWVETVEVDGEELLRATLVRHSDNLVVRTNSEERMTRLLESLPGVEVLAESREPARSFAHLSHLSDGLPETPAEEVSEEERRHLEEWIREKERAWVDESIPALGGLTPRQAVDDPTRREDLLRLLRSLERWPDMPTNAVTFDPARLRALLGIE